jgi:sulfatase maturation enzyme AslB (radical SAM superfamily)
MSQKHFPKTFCVEPFTGMRQTALGAMAPCPYGAGEWAIGHLSVRDRFFYETLERMRTQFLKGEKPAECQKCWNEEACGKKSLRVRSLKNRKEDLKLVASGLWKKGPTTLAIKTSNICNLACKMCCGMDSSKYQKEGEHYAQEYGVKYFNRYLPPHPPTPFSEKDAMQYAEMSENLTRIDFFGGEPFLNRTHLVLLKELIRRGRSRKVELYYATNATIFPSEEMIEIWRNFKLIRLGLSIDGVDKRYTYIRWPGDFEKVKENIQRYRTELALALWSGGTCFEMIGCMTLTNLNIYGLPETYKWLKKNIGNVYISLVQNPSYQCIVNLPESAKQKIYEHLRSSPHHKDFECFISFMKENPLNEKEWRKFVVTTERQDRYRKLFLKDVYAQYWSWIKEEYVPFAQELHEDGQPQYVPLEFQAPYAGANA